jgi:hypothetical protein
MPEIHRIGKIIITIYHRGEHWFPHFHAKYGDHKVSIAINTLEVLEGELPLVQLAKVKKWAKKHQDGLLDRWKLAMDNKPIPKIE